MTQRGYCTVLFNFNYSLFKSVPNFNSHFHLFHSDYIPSSHPEYIPSLHPDYIPSPVDLSSLNLLNLIPTSLSLSCHPLSRLWNPFCSTY